MLSNCRDTVPSLLTISSLNAAVASSSLNCEYDTGMVTTTRTHKEVAGTVPPRDSHLQIQFVEQVANVLETLQLWHAGRYHL